MSKIFAKTIFLLFTSLSFFSSAFAAEIINIKGTKVLIDLQGLNAKPGDEFYGMNAENKKKAILKIGQVKNGKAVAEITKGTPEVGFSLQPRVAPTAAPEQAKKKPRKEKEQITSLRATPPGWGVTLNVLMNTMSATFTGSTGAKVSTNLKGNSFGVNGFYDYPFSKQLILRGMGGYDQYQLSGSVTNNDCDNSTTCSVNVNYLSGYGIARYNLMTGATRPWVGGGLGYLFALSKASTVLKTSEITSNLLYMVSIGVDVQMKKNFLPIQFDYGMFPSSDTVKATTMFLRVGWGFDL